MQFRANAKIRQPAGVITAVLCRLVDLNGTPDSLLHFLLIQKRFNHTS